MAQQRIIKQIGNDVYINVPIYEKDGTPFVQGAAQCRFEMRNEYTEPISIDTWTIENGRLIFWILAPRIVQTGYYDLWGEVKRNDSNVMDGKATHTFDIRRILRIVKHSDEITEETARGIHGMLDMYALSAYHSYVRTTDDDPIMTEKEWVETLPFGGRGTYFRKMDIEQELESMMPGEVQIIKVLIYDAWGKDVIDLYRQIDVERDSGDPPSDAVWNSLHGENKGPVFQLLFDDLGFRYGLRGVRFNVIAYPKKQNDEVKTSQFTIG